MNALRAENDSLLAEVGRLRAENEELHLRVENARFQQLQAQANPLAAPTLALPPSASPSLHDDQPPEEPVRAKRTWKALIFGLLGGMVLLLVIVAHDLQLELTIPEADRRWAVPLIGFSIGIMAFSPLGYVCLPADTPVQSPAVRGLLEVLVVSGWLSAVVIAVIEALDSVAEQRTAPSTPT
jgi:uncharacterized integral membrane protein